MGSTQSTWGLFSEFSSCVHHEVCPCICQPFGFVCRRFHSPVQEAGPAQEPNHLQAALTSSPILMTSSPVTPPKLKLLPLWNSSVLPLEHLFPDQKQLAMLLLRRIFPA